MVMRTVNYYLVAITAIYCLLLIISGGCRTLTSAELARVRGASSTVVSIEAAQKDIAVAQDIARQQARRGDYAEAVATLRGAVAKCVPELQDCKRNLDKLAGTYERTARRGAYSLLGVIIRVAVGFVVGAGVGFVLGFFIKRVL